MDLFNNEIITNLLPNDGIAEYHGKIFDRQKSNNYFESLLTTVEWKNDEAIIFGKLIITKRKVAWYGDKGFDYTYSNTTKQALPWTRELMELKKIAEEITNATYNSCLINLYHNGDEGVTWHSDDEKTLGKNSSIASLTFGAERKFSFKHKQTRQTISVILEHGSLLVMKGATQTNWLHSIPKTRRVTQPRINLTFRTIVL